MKALVVYESMFGNTRQIAEAIAQGLRSSIATDVLLAHEAGQVDLDEIDLVVAGGPTHAWGLSRERTRMGAVVDAAKHPDHVLDPGVQQPGVREWLRSLPRGRHHARAVAFDTRLDKPKAITGSAARSIQHGLHSAGFGAFGEPHSVVVTGMAGPLASGEIERAQQWGEAMGRMIMGMLLLAAIPARAQ